MNTITGASVAGAAFQSSPAADKINDGAGKGQKLSFDHSVSLVSSTASDAIATETVSDAVEKALDRKDWIGDLFSRAFSVSCPVESST